MSEIWFRAFHGKIEEVEVLKETPQKVQVRHRGITYYEFKTPLGCYMWVRRDRAEAKALMVAAARLELEKAKRAVDTARAMLRNAEAA